MTSTTTSNLRTTAFRDVAGLCITHAGRRTKVLPTRDEHPTPARTRRHAVALRVAFGDDDDVDQFRVVRSTRTHARDVLWRGTGAGVAPGRSARYRGLDGFGQQALAAFM